MKLTKKLKRHDGKHWPKIATSMLAEAWKFGKDVVLTIALDEETRSTKQNRLLFLWHGELAKHIYEHQGQLFDTETIHEFIVGKLLPRKAVTMPDGEPVIVRESTRSLKTKQFAEFLSTYEMWANENYQCRFTQPDDLYFAALMRDEPPATTDGM